MDTIVALATPPGRGALGLIRISGPESLAVAGRVFPAANALKPRRSQLSSALDASGQTLDEGLLTFFPRGQSFTGEATVEFCGHGSPALLNDLLAELIKAGARPARPGEFTWQAFKNKKLSLDQAEAVNQLIHAESRREAHLALEQMHGALAQRLAPCKELLLNALAQVQAGIDFVEDQDAALDHGRLDSRLTDIQVDLQNLSKAVRRGALLHDGVRVVLAGRPNVGKSSLFNGLLSEERALVTPVAGTTRDALHGRLELKGVPITLVDTAGLRDSQDQVELLGIERSQQAVAAAHLVCLVVDGRQPLNPEEQELWHSLPEQRRLLVRTHADQPAGAGPSGFEPSVFVSNLTGEGLDDCLSALEALVDGEALADDSLLMSTFQKDQLQTALDLVNNAVAARQSGLSEEALAADLELALNALDQLTGETPREDVFDRVFSTFCIGK